MVDNTTIDKLWKQMDSQYKDKYKELMESKDRKIKSEI
jgi:hypothetical protein